MCGVCGGRVRAPFGRWVHDPRGASSRWAARQDANHSAVRVWGEPAATPADPPPVKAKPARLPRRPIAPVPQTVNWGPPMPFTRRPFNADQARLRGCEAAAGLDTIGEL